MKRLILPLSLFGSLTVGVLGGVGPGRSQIVPDATLPVNSSVLPGCTACVITGGTERGVNLYHSFQQFSIPTGGSAWFNNGAQIQNILTRVTGSSVSTIDGLLRANGTANLFLLNPNGITFGPNAGLQIGGSFLATTANSFKFADGSEFGAVNPQDPPLLTLNITPGVQYSRGQGAIANDATLMVGNGQSLTLLGGDVTSRGTLTAPGGRVEVLGDRVALLDNAQVDVSSPTGGGTVAIGGNYKGQGILPNAHQTYVAPTAVINANATSTGDGGTVVVWADDTTRFYGTILARGGAQSGNGGFVEVSGAQSLIFNGLVDTSAPLGQTGTLLLDPTNITVIQGSTPIPVVNATDGIWAAAEDPGNQVIGTNQIVALLNANALTLEATNTISFSPGAEIFANSANNLTLNAADILVRDAILRQNGGGSITLNATNLVEVSTTPTVQGGNSFNTFAQLDTSTYGTQNAGNISINANTVRIVGWSFLTSNVENGGNATGGTIRIRANSLSVLNSAQIQAILRGQNGNLPAANGTVGKVDIDVTGPVVVSGLGFPGNVGIEARIASDIGTLSTSVGQQQDTIIIKAGSLTVSDRATIATTTYSNGQGDAGNINIQANDVTISNATLRSNIEQEAIGQGGNIQIQAANSLTLSNGGSINLDTAGLGNAGSSEIRAETLTVTDGARLSASTAGVGAGGNVLVKANNVSLDNRAEINTSTAGVGDAGRITVQAKGTVTLRNQSEIRSAVLPTAAGNSEGITVQARSLELVSGSKILTTTEGQGRAGTIEVVVTDGVTLSSAGTGIFASTSSAPNLTPIRISANELADAGDAISTAQDLTQGGPGTVVNQISGFLSGGNDVDLFKITLTGNQTFSASSANQDTNFNFDTRLVLFDANGRGVYANEDNTTTDLRAVLPSNNPLTPTAPGTYYLAIASYPNQPFSTSGNLFDFDNFNYTEIKAPTGPGGTEPLGGWSNNGFGSGNYTITLTGIAPNRFSADAGSVTVKANSLAISDGAQIAANTTGSGQAANISVDVQTFNARSGGQLLTTTSGSGKAADINLTATQQATLTDPGTGLFANTTNGIGGNITVNAGQFAIANGATLNATTTSSNPGGNIAVKATTLDATGGSRLLTSTSGAGKAGDISLDVRDRVSLNNPETGLFAGTSGGLGGAISIATNDFQISNGAVLDTTTTGNSAGGNITLTTQVVTGTDGAQLRTTTSGAGDAGKITLTVGDLVNLAGASTALLANTAANSRGAGGDITVTANSLNAAEGAQLTTTTAGRGRAGNTTVNLRDRLFLSDPGTGLFASTTPGSTGNGGNITITDPRRALIQDGAAIAVNSDGSGIGGNIFLQAGRLELRDRGSITAETANAQGGNITLNVNDLVLLRRNSLISATAGTAQSSGNGGNITINTPFVIGVLSEDSDIRANAFSGNGGNITINAQQIFGLRPQPQNTPFSDITASSQLGISGSITLNTLNLDPSRGLEDLNLAPVDPSKQVSQSCNGSRNVVAGQNKFVILGRGGLSASPESPLSGTAVLDDLGSPTTSSPTATQPSPTPQANVPTPIIEAQSWVEGADGKVYLVNASISSAVADAPSPSLQCRGL